LSKPDKKKQTFAVEVQYMDGSKETLEVSAQDYVSATEKIERDSSKKPRVIKLKLPKQPKNSLPYIY